MFEIFPGNYTWNLSVNIAVNPGAHITEVAEACAPVPAASREGEDDGTELFFHSWTGPAEWFTGREGGVEHVSADNMPATPRFIADWVAKILP